MEKTKKDNRSYSEKMLDEFEGDKYSKNSAGASGALKRASDNVAKKAKKKTKKGLSTKKEWEQVNDMAAGKPSVEVGGVPRWEDEMKKK